MESDQIESDLMIIAIAGLTGSGKNTLGEALAKELKLKLVCPTFKDLAKKEGISLMEFQKRAEKDPNIDLKFDALLKEEAAKGNCVITTWLGAWMVDADFRIYVKVDDKIRAGRIAKRDNMNPEEALKHIKTRDNENIRRYKKLYSIDITDTSKFDLVIQAGEFTKEQLKEIVLKEIKKRKVK